MAVAIGEAAQQPVSFSVLGDLYSQRRRGSAIAALAIGGLVGLSLGATLAGVLNDHFGWHIAFLLLGIPGVVIAALMWLTVPEPVRGSKDGGLRHDPLAATTWGSLKHIFSIPSVCLMALAQCVLASAQLSWLTWLPKLFMNVHHLTAQQMSIVYGVVVGLGALVSIVAGGLLSDWLTKFGPRWRMYYVAASLLLSAPLAAAGVLSGDLKIAIIQIFLYTLLAGGVTPAAGAAGLGVVRPTMRALMTAVLFFAVFAVGGTIGPLAIGMATDALQKTYGDDAIRYALLISPALLVVAGLIFFAASFFLDRDTDAATRYGGDEEAARAS
jgi:predicted MFS family arabinose efflux permease